MWTTLFLAALSLSPAVVQCASNPFNGKPLPKAIVLDLDHTTWKAYLDSDFQKSGAKLPEKGDDNPFKPDGPGKLKDKHDKVWEYSPDVVSIATDAKKAKVKLAVASKSPKGEKLYSDFLKAIKAPGCSGGTLYSCFDVVIIKEGDKKSSLEDIAKKTGAKPEDMILFDDDTRNKKAADDAHVYFSLVGEGGKRNPLLLTSQMVEKGVEGWRKEGGKKDSEGKHKGKEGKDSEGKHKGKEGKDSGEKHEGKDKNKSDEKH